MPPAAAQILVDGVNFASAIEGTQAKARANGCSAASDAGPRDVPGADGLMVCTDYCGGAPSKPAAKICGMPNVPHNTDFPHPGFVYQQSWAWFEEQVKAAAAAGGRHKSAAGSSTATRSSSSSWSAPAAAGPLLLNITMPGASLRWWLQAADAFSSATIHQQSLLTRSRMCVMHHLCSCRC
jgi:hypothetical protein